MAELPKSVRNLILAFERLPGVGPKSAARLVFYLLNTPKAYVMDLAKLLVEFKDETKICRECFSVSDKETCPICKDVKRNKKIVCVVEKAIDVMAVEALGGFNGVYHVLGGVINPLDHVGPEDLKIFELIEKIKKFSNDGIDLSKVEVILATNPTMEGEATALYIKKKLEGLEVKITRIGSGLPMGADLEYADQATLSRALDGRRDL